MSDEEQTPNRVMTFEDWDQVLDAKLLYNLYDDFECRMAALRSDNRDTEYTVEEDRNQMERILKALVMFAARCLATTDTALVLTQQCLPNSIVLMYIEHLIHAFHHVKGYGEPECDHDHDDGDYES